MQIQLKLSPAFRTDGALALCRMVPCRQLLAMLLVAVFLDCSAENSVVETSTEPSLSYARLYEDAEGISHFGEGELQLNLEDYSPPANPIAVHALQGLGSATFVLLPRGAAEDWHPAPRRQFAIIVRGTVEVTAGDREARRFGPGNIVLLEDINGMGHQTRVIGDEDSLTVMLAVADN